MLAIDGLKKNCPICDQEDPPFEGHVRPSGDIRYKYKCSRCGHSHIRVVKAPEYTVEALTGFNREPYRWEPQP